MKRSIKYSKSISVRYTVYICPVRPMILNKCSNQHLLFFHRVNLWKDGGNKFSTTFEVIYLVHHAYQISIEIGSKLLWKSGKNRKTSVSPCQTSLFIIFYTIPTPSLILRVQLKALGLNQMLTVVFRGVKMTKMAQKRLFDPSENHTKHTT